ncbi:amidohydrolase family protein [Luteitalea pratensis]|uniref:amidohydrolase family protein n=1 Tax=Luteitalea pratensis TaxID=1855912 RepID=UPI001F15D79D|nr:amidohydrolase family protein [Luteitalea pratensis]
MNRREWLTRTGAVMGAAVATTGAEARGEGDLRGETMQGQEPAPKPDASLKLVDYQPKSMLHVPVTVVEKAAFPVIDMHTHLTVRNAQANARQSRRAMPPEDLLKVMDARNIRTMVNLTGGQGERLAGNIAGLDRAHPGRFLTFTEPTWTEAQRPDYAKWQADQFAAAKTAGAMGVKVLKTLGLFLRDKDAAGKDGALVKVDDPRFDPMWEQAGALGFPVAIHVGDPEAFFLPTDRYNERYEELANHPDWSFHGKDFPAFKAVLEARDRVFKRHPKTTFVALHVGHWAENLPAVGEMLDTYKNVHIEIGARIGELGRQPRQSRKFFDKYQDRIMFGTDAVPNGTETPQQIFGLDLYQIYYRFLQTEDEYFDYAPAPVPPQGRWQIYGIGLPEPILKKVYLDNALRALPRHTAP